MSNKCECLYKALCTTKAQYQKEEAKTKYTELVTAAEHLSQQQQEKVTSLLNTAKRILGDIGLEHIYAHSGTTNEYQHTCEENEGTIKLIQALDHSYASGDNIATMQPGLADKTTTHRTQRSKQRKRASLAEHDNSHILIDQIIDHRFRGRKLNFIVITKPGGIRITESQETVTQLATGKITEYLNSLRNGKPRRLSHIIRMKPDLINLL